MIIGTIDLFVFIESLNAPFLNSPNVIPLSLVPSGNIITFLLFCKIFNTDQGNRYTSYIHTQTLKNNGIIISMDGKGRATDNICIERFWRSAKVERIYLNEYNSIRELKDDVKDYMEFYNHRRFHETLQYKKPMCVYRDSLKLNRSDYEIIHKSVA